jgi:nucleoid-associated protein YgaU
MEKPLTAAVPVEEEPSPPPASTQIATPAPPENTSESPREILRMDTEAFTLTVERPSADPQPSSASPSEPVPPLSTMIVHRVIPGDTLWDIAAHYLGDPFQYPELARLSQIRNPDLIYPGDVIRIIKKGG